MTTLDAIRLTDGSLPPYAWPGGYPIYYLTRDGLAVCPRCANREVDDHQAAIAYDINWEAPQLLCDDCGERIESAYADDPASDGE
jgi:hypothetical protein